MKILEKEIWSEPARIAEVIDFLKVCSEYDPDDTPMWFLEELEEDDEEEENEAGDGAPEAGRRRGGRRGTCLRGRQR